MYKVDTTMTSGRPDLQRRMAIWYLKKYHPGVCTFKYQFPVFDDRLFARSAELIQSDNFFSRAMPRIDLIVEGDTWIDIVEIKANPKLKDISELKFYENALKHDSKRASMLAKKKILVFLTVDDHKSIQIYAEEFGIRYIYVPEHELPPAAEIYMGIL